MKTLQEKMKALPAARRNKIKRGTDQLIREEMTLRELAQGPQHYAGEPGPFAQGEAGAGFPYRAAERPSHFHPAPHDSRNGRRADHSATFPHGAPVKIAGLGELLA
jgi:hypothetical protein